MSNRRHRTPTSAPLSTKLAVGVGVVLVGGGFGLAGWQRLTADDGTEPAPTVTHAAQQYLPSVETVVAYAAVILAVVIAGAYVLVRARRQRGNL